MGVVIQHPLSQWL